MRRPLHSRRDQLATVAGLTFMAVAGVLTAVPVARGSSTVQGTGTTAFVNVNVVPMDSERTLQNYTVIVRDGRIVDMGPAGTLIVPASAARIEGRGKFLMPGLAEMHGHIPSGDFANAVMFL
jgi:imidazolonepropionase-like amidohydrolase